MEFLKIFAMQLFFTVGIIVIFGFLIALCRRAFCKITGTAGPKILLATGIVGTPIHELSHALMCLIFGHKINEIKLFNPKAENGALGYVDHAYNPKNIYHQIGNFFIGTAPIVVGSGVLMLLTFLIIPDVCADVAREFKFLDAADFKSFFEAFLNIVGYLFNTDNLSNIFWWIFIILALSISSHMELSSKDIKGSVKGFLILSAGLLLVDIVMYFAFFEALEAMTSALASFSLSIALFLTLSLIFLIAMLLIALIIRGIAKIIGR